MAISILSGLAGLAALVAIIIPISLYYAWAASHLWAWFVVPAFGAPALSILQIWGICLTLAMFRPRFNTTKSDTEELASGFLALICGPPLSLLLGYAIKSWWM